VTFKFTIFFKSEKKKKKKKKEKQKEKEKEKVKLLIPHQCDLYFFIQKGNTHDSQNGAVKFDNRELSHLNNNKKSRPGTIYITSLTNGLCIARLPGL
jgi:hypothetical protein